MLSARAAIRDVTWALRWGTSPHPRTLRTSPPGNRYPKSVPNTAGNSLWGRSPSFSFWLAICWVSLGFAAGSYNTCGHTAGQSQSCVCTRPLHKLAFCSLGRREAFFKGFPCILYLRLNVSVTGFSLGKLRRAHHVMCSFLSPPYVRAVPRAIRGIFSDWLK